MSRTTLIVALLLAAPALLAAPKKGDPVPDQYIVVLAKTGTFGGLIDGKEIAKLGNELAGKYGGKVLLTYGNALNGYVANLNAEQAALLGKDPAVKYLEQDSFVGFARTQSKAPWGLDRLDDRSPGLDGTYRYPDSAGKGVNIYVIDTGVRGTHQEFGDRYRGGVNFAAKNPADANHGDTKDCNGHGTHVAGTVAGDRYGVAKEARIYGVRVLDCDGSGTMSGVIAGVDWVEKNARKPAVANLSLGGGASRALDEALDRLIDNGVVAVVAAGNDNQDACNASPARVKNAITVAASDKEDKRASFSNWGECVDVFAPGFEIKSAWFEKDNQNATLSGTSMAAPHVAGLVALYMAEMPSARPRELVRELLRDARDDLIKDARGSPNRMAYSGNIRDRRPDEGREDRSPQPGGQVLPPVRLPIGN